MLSLQSVGDSKSVTLKTDKWTTPKWFLMIPVKWSWFGISTGICFAYWSKPAKTD